MPARRLDLAINKEFVLSVGEGRRLLIDPRAVSSFKHTLARRLLRRVVAICGETRGILRTHSGHEFADIVRARLVERVDDRCSKTGLMRRILLRNAAGRVATLPHLSVPFCRPLRGLISFHRRDPRAYARGYNLPPLRGWLTINYRRTAHCPLPTAHCPLPTAHCSLLTDLPRAGRGWRGPGPSNHGSARRLSAWPS